MVVSRWTKRPVTIEAVRLNSDNAVEVADWCGGLGKSLVNPDNPDDGSDRILKMEIETLEGVITASEGDYIIKRVKGEFYPCKPDIFMASYMAAE